MEDNDHLPEDPLHNPLEAQQRFLNLEELLEQGLIDQFDIDLLEEGGIGGDED